MNSTTHSKFSSTLKIRSMLKKWLEMPGLPRLDRLMTRLLMPSLPLDRKWKLCCSWLRWLRKNLGWPANTTKTGCHSLPRSPMNMTSWASTSTSSSGRLIRVDSRPIMMAWTRLCWSKQMITTYLTTNPMSWWNSTVWTADAGGFTKMKWIIWGDASSSSRTSRLSARFLSRSWKRNLRRWGRGPSRKLSRQITLKPHEIRKTFWVLNKSLTKKNYAWASLKAPKKLSKMNPRTETNLHQSL